MCNEYLILLQTNDIVDICRKIRFVQKFDTYISLTSLYRVMVAFRSVITKCKGVLLQPLRSGAGEVWTEEGG